MFRTKELAVVGFDVNLVKCPFVAIGSEFIKVVIDAREAASVLEPS